LLLGIAFSLSGSFGLIPSAEGASASASARIIKKLKKQIATLKAQLAAATAKPPTPAPFMEMVKVGNVGNAADQDFGDGQFGTVPYEYSIGKYEVTLAQYTDFLNAVAATDTHALFNENMATYVDVAGIAQNGASPNFTYTVIGDGARPVTFVSWFDAARFCNWLHNGRPTGLQTSATTENGAYPLNGATSGGLTIIRNPGAKVWIPSEDEWYKAAYHQPFGQGGDGDDYWLYATATNSAPGAATPSAAANLANFSYVVNGLTPAGAYTGSAGFYGTFDQGGNVFEWNDAVISGSFRGLRGGSWLNDVDTLRSSFRYRTNPENDSSSSIGFRVASP